MHRPVEKLYLLVRGDLPPGLQLAQAVHASVEFTLRYRDRAASTPTVVVLTVDDEEQLLGWADVLGWKDRSDYALFHEPDLGEHTALAIVSDGTRFAGLPLAGCAMAT